MNRKTIRDLEKKTTPELMMVLGAKLDTLSREEGRFWGRPNKELNKGEIKASIQFLSDLLTQRLNRLELFGSDGCETALDSVDAKILSTLFYRQVHGRHSDCTDFCDPCGDDLKGKLEVRRRLRRGTLAQSGIIKFYRSTTFDLDAEHFEYFLDLGEFEEAQGQNLQERFKPSALPPIPIEKGDYDDPEDDFMFFFDDN